MVAKGKLFLVFAIGSFLVLLTSCQVPIALWIIPGSTNDNLVFGFSRSRQSKAKAEPGSLKVFPCSVIGRKQPGGSYFPSDEHAVWVAVVPNGKRYHESAKATNRLTYGRDEFGLRTELGPKALTAPGCYVATVTASDAVSGANLLFKIGNDGVVVEVDDPKEFAKVFDK